MGSLSKALVGSFLEERDGVHIYSGEVDKLWTALGVPFGGYSLSLIVSACILAQARKTHTEVAHVTAQFPRTTSLGHYQVLVRTNSTGRSFEYLSAELIQKNEVKVLAQFIFKAPSFQTDTYRMSLLPPSPYARRVPLHMHPAAVQATRRPLKNIAFASCFQWGEDKAIRERNRELGKHSTIGGGGLEWGAWLEFLDPMENINAAILSFIADIYMPVPKLLPKEQRPPASWFADLVMSLEYKAKIPDNPMYSKRTVGLYSCGKFLYGGQHDVSLEIWTAPSDIGQGVEVDGWRDRQVCLGIAHHMATTIPISVKKRIGARSKSKL